jgi:Protein of unknown function (DUF402)
VGWRSGERIVRREVWRGVPWLATVVVVVEDAPDLLATYLPEDAPFAFPPSADGRAHPWSGKERWEGHGVLMLQRPGEAYAVWHFWDGPARDFAGWYLNLQEPFRRTETGFDTQDLELDVWVPADGPWTFKDAELLAERVADGRLTESQVESIRSLGEAIGAMLDRGDHWWDARWASFVPPGEWRAPELPEGWEGAPVPTGATPSELVART